APASRTQLAQANAHVLSPQHSNELVTIHGTAMIFLVMVPILAGFANYLVPLMIGARDVAFPRLNALSYWLFLLGGVVLMLSFFAKGPPGSGFWGGAATAGWTSYVPLAVQTPGNWKELWLRSPPILTAPPLTEPTK